MTSHFHTVGIWALLALGFGFVVFWHELGHFLAAKWAGVRVEQFAVGFAHAVASWRKGMGFRLGSSQDEYKRRIFEKLNRTYPPAETDTPPSDLEMREAGESLGFGETEYRINWLPLGGYVKMLGQDDLRPNSEADDPKAYNRQTVGKRMVIVSAGVVMNIILAAVGFVVLFSPGVGFHVAPAKVGQIMPNSPAQRAGLRVGDELLTLDGTQLYGDWTKVMLNAALCASDVPISVQVKRLDGKIETLSIVPQKNGGMVSLGLGAHQDLKGLDSKKGEVIAKLFSKEERELHQASDFLIEPDDEIVGINGKSGNLQLADLDAASQTGRPVKLDIKRARGAVETVEARPSFVQPFGEQPFNVLGMIPRQMIDSISRESPTRGQLHPGDIVTAIACTDSNGDRQPIPTFADFAATVKRAAEEGKKIVLTVLRSQQELQLGEFKPIEVSRGKYGMSVGLAVDDGGTVVASTIKDTPAQKLGIPKGARITQVDGKDVANWTDVHLALRDRLKGAQNSATVPITFEANGNVSSSQLELAAADIQSINDVRYDLPLQLRESENVRKGANFFDALVQGGVETRDFITQFYVTLKRMATRDVSPTNLMGPIGMFQTGSTIASRGGDWLLWFLSMISANLAVVNFLPIPVVDGGLFMFLIIEKIKGRPASPKTQMIAQYVGLALLLFVFVFVTWQDVANIKFR